MNSLYGTSSHEFVEGFSTQEISEAAGYRFGRTVRKKANGILGDSGGGGEGEGGDDTSSG